MKTPREVLFAHHHRVERKLDSIRRTVVAGIEASAPQTTESNEPWALRLVTSVWRGLFLPSRVAWVALGLIWIGIVAADFGEAGSEPAAKASSGPDASAVVARNWEEQQRVLAELLRPPAAKPEESMRANSPARRSELRPVFKTC